MSDPLHDLRRLADETSPDEDEVERIKARLRDELDASSTLLRHLPDADDAAQQRVRARVLETLDARAVRPHRLRQVTVGFAAAAAAALALGLLLPRSPEGPTPLARELNGDDERVQATALVSLDYAGEGHLHGTAQAPRLEWRSGRVDVDVEPDHGVDLRVQTDEAEVRVVGTVFTVERDVYGTHVSVQRGHVKVSCYDGSEHDLLAAGSATCKPVSAAQLSAYAKRLRADGRPPQLVLDTVERAFAHNPSAYVFSELLETMHHAQRALGRHRDALATARQYLDGSAALRRLPMLRSAATVARDAGGCRAALPWLRELSDSSASVDDLIHHADCLQQLGSPRRAHAILSQALGLQPTPSQERELRRRISSLSRGTER